MGTSCSFISIVFRISPSAKFVQAGPEVAADELRSQLLVFFNRSTNRLLHVIPPSIAKPKKEELLHILLQIT